MVRWLINNNINNNNNNNNNNNLSNIQKISNNIPVKHEIRELQKAAILDTTHILRIVLMQKYRTLYHGK